MTQLVPHKYMEICVSFVHFELFLNIVLLLLIFSFDVLVNEKKRRQYMAGVDKLICLKVGQSIIVCYTPRARTSEKIKEGKPLF